jgi:hypothetical protein
LQLCDGTISSGTENIFESKLAPAMSPGTCGNRVGRLIHGIKIASAIDNTVTASLAIRTGITVITVKQQLWAVIQLVGMGLVLHTTVHGNRSRKRVSVGHETILTKIHIDPSSQVIEQRFIIRYFLTMGQAP